MTRKAPLGPGAAPKLGEQHDIQGDIWQISIPKTRIHTLPQLLDYCQVDTQVWEVERFQVNKWEVGAKIGPEGAERVDVEQLFQVKAWLRRKRAVAAAKDEIRRMMDEAAKFAPRYPLVKRPKCDSGNLLEMNLTDHHFGKLAWSPETGGWGDYDLKIADRCWDEATDGILSRVPDTKFERVIFVIGNDLMHVDNQAGTTTRGTQVTADTRFQKIYPAVRRAIIRSVDKAMRLAPVKVVVVPGNHDMNASFCMGDSIWCWYRNCRDVEVENGPAPRKYFQWGSVMLMWTHGSEGKLGDYPQIMAVEEPEMWGQSRIREVHTGDKHQRRLEEFHGVAVRILPSLCAPDDWHSKKGFVGNWRSSEAFVWNKDQGLVSTATYTGRDQFRASEERKRLAA